MKYINCGVVFQEIPDEVTLSINISNCPCRCPGCHSKYLWKDEGEELNTDTMDSFITEYGRDITGICLMGGDANPMEVNHLAQYINQHYPEVRVAWYSGRARVPHGVNMCDFDYVKLGPYIAHLGGLKEPTTNQHLYKRMPNGDFQDITSRFWKSSKR